MRGAARLAALGSSVALSLALGAATADASITLGQTTSAPVCSGGPNDLIQPTVTSGTTYVAPADGTITSWSTIQSSTGSPAGKMKLKVFRKVGESARYEAVTQDVFRQLTYNTTNTFNVTMGGVQAGDVIGLTYQGNATCFFSAPGDSFFFSPSDLSNGQSADFTSQAGSRLDISAVFEPSHKFGIGATLRNKKKGSAILDLDLPGPGQVTVTGKGVKHVTAPVGAKGTAGVPIKATGSKRKTLNERGKVTLNVGLAYTPTGGTEGTNATKVKLRKKL